MINYKAVYDMILETYQNVPWTEGCHKHRILPGYLGGMYTEDNVIFVSQRIHSIIHFLRWKLYKDLRDKRAQKMIGIGPSGLSHQDRIDHGIHCAKHKIGFHGASEYDKIIWRNRGWSTQKDEYLNTGKKNFYYWATVEGRKERASIGGLASYGKNKAFIDQQGSFTDKLLASNAAKKSAKKPVTDGKVIRKFHTDDQVTEFLLNNLTWRRGCPTKNEKLELVK